MNNLRWQICATVHLNYSTKVQVIYPAILNCIVKYTPWIWHHLSDHIKNTCNVTYTTILFSFYLLIHVMSSKLTFSSSGLSLCSATRWGSSCHWSSCAHVRYEVFQIYIFQRFCKQAYKTELYKSTAHFQCRGDGNI